jgi:hypothetical protein
MAYLLHDARDVGGGKKLVLLADRGVHAIVEIIRHSATDELCEVQDLADLQKQIAMHGCR